MTAIVWFTFDLRLKDNPALHHACKHHKQVIPVFVHDPKSPLHASGAAAWWLHHSLKSLENDLKDKQGKLILRAGKTLDVLQTLIEQSKAEAVYFARGYEPWLNTTQQSLHTLCSDLGVVCKRFSGRMLLEPETLLNQQGNPFQVFTPFYKTALQRLPSPLKTLPAPASINTPRGIASDRLNTWHLTPSRPNWAKGFEGLWQPGEKRTLALLKHFGETRAGEYDAMRDYPAHPGTSGLSAALHFGEVSPRSVWALLTQQSPVPEAFLRQIIWREFALYLLHHHPQTLDQPFKKKFAPFPWQHNEQWLTQWQLGQTGYPLVDAGMRQLWHTGWMHNRVRMVVASFLTKHCLIHWQHGAEWFWQTLVDADQANNTMGWQWVAGCGADAAPYFRIFNPSAQAKKFDGEGSYIKQWVPELAALPTKHLFEPWLAPKAELARAGIELGKHYPHPIVNHELARKGALQAYEYIKTSD